MKKRIVALIAVMAIMCGLVACGADEKVAGDKEQETATVTETVTEAVTEAPTEEATPEVTAEPKETPANVQEEVVAAYANFLRYYVEQCIDGVFTTSGMVKFYMGCVDEDDIPELLIMDGDIHANGVHVCRYDNGTVTDIGQFGEFGSFSFLSRENRICSFYMGMGIRDVIYYAIDGNGTKELKHFFADDDTPSYEIDDVQVGANEFEEAFDKYTESNENVRTVNYPMGVSYNKAASLLTEYLGDMYLAAVDDIEFINYFPKKMVSMQGIWDFEDAEYTDKDGTRVTRKAKERRVNSTLVIDENCCIDFKLAINGGETFENYSMPLRYEPTAMYDGCKNNEWCTNVESFDYDRYYYVTLTDEDTLELMIEYLNYSTGVSDSVIAHYKRGTHSNNREDNLEHITGNITPCSNNEMGKDYLAYTFEETIMVTAEDKELIEAYGLPKDLDGYDYEIVTVPDSTKTIYCSKKDTKYSYIAYEDKQGNSGIFSYKCKWKKFNKHFKENSYLNVTITVPAGVAPEDCIIVEMFEDYTG